ncbi:hypothetical protein AB3M80_07665 [Arthrospira platensis BEA 1257B]
MVLNRSDLSPEPEMVEDVRREVRAVSGTHSTRTEEPSPPGNPFFLFPCKRVLDSADVKSIAPDRKVRTYNGEEEITKKTKNASPL